MKQLVLFLMLVFFSGCDGIVDITKEDRSRLNQIARIYGEGDFVKTIDQLKDYVQDYPSDSLAHTILGHAYLDEDRSEEAQAAYETAIKIDPKRVEALTGLGVLFRKLGDYEAAMEAYEKAVEIDNRYAQAYSSMTTIALKRNDDKKALEYARKGYELEPDNPVIAANLAVAYHYNGDQENRDKYTSIAKRLGYKNHETFAQIYSGEVTIRD